MFARVFAVGTHPSGDEYCDLQLLSGLEYLPLFKDDIEWVAVGNTSTPSRASLIYLSSDDTYSPIIELRSGVDNYTKFGDISTLLVRIGVLDGITDPDFGALTGDGFYGKNLYLKGKMILAAGSVIQWADVSGSGKPENNATVGADFFTNVDNRPLYLQSTYIDFAQVASGRLIARRGAGSLEAGITSEGSADTDVRIYAGAAYANRATAPFRVTQGGALTATSATITGAITASTITASTLATGSSGNYIQLGTEWAGGVGYLKAIYGTKQVVVCGSGIDFYSTIPGYKGLRINDNTGHPEWEGSVIWYAGNDGSGSGLDADLWDGKHMPANALGNLHNDGNGNLSWV
jgi:hypothetical protein